MGACTTAEGCGRAWGSGSRHSGASCCPHPRHRRQASAKSAPALLCPFRKTMALARIPAGFLNPPPAAEGPSDENVPYTQQRDCEFRRSGEAGDAHKPFIVSMRQKPNEARVLRSIYQAADDLPVGQDQAEKMEPGAGAIGDDCATESYCGDVS